MERSCAAGELVLIELLLACEAQPADTAVEAARAGGYVQAAGLVYDAGHAKPSRADLIARAEMRLELDGAMVGHRLKGLSSMLDETGCSALLCPISMMRTLGRRVRAGQPAHRDPPTLHRGRTPPCQRGAAAMASAAAAEPAARRRQGPAGHNSAGLADTSVGGAAGGAAAAEAERAACDGGGGEAPPARQRLVR